MSQTLATKPCALRHVEPIGNIELDFSVAYFHGWGFNFGDSVDVVLDNGYAFRDIPFYSGFYGPGNKPILYGWTKAYHYIGIGYPISGNPWQEADARNATSATVYLRERRKYLDIEKGMNLGGVKNPSYYYSQTAFANWRKVLGGSLKPGVIYRSTSPVRPDIESSEIADTLLGEHAIHTVLNLSDSAELVRGFLAQEGKARGSRPQKQGQEQEYKNEREQEREQEHGHEHGQEHGHEHQHKHEHYRVLFESGAVKCLFTGVDYTSLAFKQKVAEGLGWLACQEPPYLVHCKYGLDRTGFVCMLLEMLGGASLDELRHDFMYSYRTIFGLNPASKQYQMFSDIRFGEMVEFMQSLAAHGATLEEQAKAYLRQGGMSEASLNKLEHILTQ